MEFSNFYFDDWNSAANVGELLGKELILKPNFIVTIDGTRYLISDTKSFQEFSLSFGMQM